MKQIIGSKIVFLLLLFFVIISPGTSKYLTAAASAGDGSKVHWVSPTGTAGWSDCENATDPGPGKYCKLGYGSNGLNDQVRAGDTVYLKGGTYLWTPTTWYGALNPNHSGTQSQRILISAAPGETPVIEAENDNNDGYMYAISFGIGPSVDTTINYTRITGITFRNMPRMAYVRNSSSYNEIDHCTFENTKLGKYGIILTGMCAGGGSMTCYVTHNWIHDNTLIRANVSGCAEIGAYADLIRVGDDGGAWDGTGENNYNTIENNVLSYASHSVMDVFGRFNVIKNNTAHKQPRINKLAILGK